VGVEEGGEALLLDDSIIEWQRTSKFKVLE